ncbi:MAG TPA: pyrimidine 5'-nucleotidase, partial [Anaerolineae bacterium]
MLKVILFDLDETLYPRSSLLMHEIGKRIEHYVTRYVGIPPAEAEVCRRRWRTTYGTALRGMMEEGYSVDVDDYLHYVHDVPLEGVISPQPEVRQMLRNIPLRRVVLTNSDSAHARRVLGHLNLLDCFEQIIDLRALEFVNKPDPKAYQRALDIL